MNREYSLFISLIIHRHCISRWFYFSFIHSFFSKDFWFINFFFVSFILNTEYLTVCLCVCDSIQSIFVILCFVFLINLLSSGLPPTSWYNICAGNQKFDFCCCCCWLFCCFLFLAGHFSTTFNNINILNVYFLFIFSCFKMKNVFAVLEHTVRILAMAIVMMEMNRKIVVLIWNIFLLISLHSNHHLAK